MAFDLLIKGGLVVDGTGVASQVAAAGIVDGRGDALPGQVVRNSRCEAAKNGNGAAG